MRLECILLAAVGMLLACGQTEDARQRVSRAESVRAARADSAALKVAVTPTLDCLPMYVARTCNLFDTLGADVRLRPYTAQMDCDTAFERSRVEGMATDLVRGQRLIRRGFPLTYVTATDAYWQLVTNRNARLTQLRHLDDRMVAMTRFSATALLADEAVSRGRLKPERVFMVQINDVGVRLDMLRNNSMDAMLLPEPQAAVARHGRHRVLLDSRSLDICLGAVAFRPALLKDTARKRQIDVFVKAYNMACDSINKNGVAAYRDLIARFCGVPELVVDSAMGALRFRHAALPRKKDIEAADKWLDRQ